MANLVPLAVADFETQLTTAISAGDTSFSIASATDDDGNSLPAGMYCFTVNNGSSNKQYLLGQLNGTAVTSVKWVSRQGVETSGAQNAARAGSPVIISDFATIQRVADILRGQLALDGSNPLVYDAEPTLADRKEMATVGYVLDTVSGGTVSFDEQVITGTAGETFDAGSLVYFKTSDQEWYKTDADTSATVDGTQIGIALGAGTDGVSISGGVQISGTWATTGLTAGAAYYPSGTAGALSSTIGTYGRVIGLALSTTKLLLVNTIPTALTSEQTTVQPKSISTFYKSLTAGETINGATLPVPVYQNKTDNEFYACDANDTAKMKFVGFAISNGTDGNAIRVQFAGVVSGFTGLAEGEKYYVQDTAGTIGTTIGTYEILVGVAISETELLIQKGRRHAKDYFTTGTSASSQVLTVGFRPSVIRVYSAYVSNSGSSSGIGDFLFATWSNGTFDGIYACQEGGGSSANGNGTYLYTNVSGGDSWTLSISAVTDTSFTISWAETGDAGARGIYWEAEGEL